MSRQAFFEKYERAMADFLATGTYEDDFSVLRYNPETGGLELAYKTQSDRDTDRYKKHGPSS